MSVCCFVSGTSSGLGVGLCFLCWSSFPCVCFAFAVTVRSMVSFVVVRLHAVPCVVVLRRPCTGPYACRRVPMPYPVLFASARLPQHSLDTPEHLTCTSARVNESSSQFSYSRPVNSKDRGTRPPARQKLASPAKTHLSCEHTHLFPRSC